MIRVLNVPVMQQSAIYKS